MASLQHHLVAGLIAQRDVQYLDVDGRPQRLHLEQSDDKLCGPMALAQAVMLLCGWPRSAVGNPKTRREPMRTFWRHAMAFQSGGTSEYDLLALAALLAPAIDLVVTETSNATRVGALASAAIDGGHVPLVRYTTSQHSHWTMASAYERDASGSVLALLLLDTDLSAPWAVPFNARLELRPDKRRAYPYAIRGTDGELWHAAFDSVCVVRRAGRTR
jgi:hypothetical protein